VIRSKVNEERKRVLHIIVDELKAVIGDMSHRVKVIDISYHVNKLEGGSCHLPAKYLPLHLAVAQEPFCVV